MTDKQKIDKAKAVAVNVYGAHDMFGVYISKKEAKYLADQNVSNSQFEFTLIEDGTLHISQKR